MRRLVFALVFVASAAGNAAVDAPAAESAHRAPSKRKSPLPLVAGVGVAALSAVPVVRRSATSFVRKLINRDDPLAGLDADSFAGSMEEPKKQQGMPSGPGPSAQGTKPPPASQAAAGAEGEQFQLTPDRLSMIAELNGNLEEIAPQLASVPVFTAAVGNGTSPLTVPADDGKKVSAPVAASSLARPAMLEYTLPSHRTRTQSPVHSLRLRRRSSPTSSPSTPTPRLFCGRCARTRAWSCRRR